MILRTPGWTWCAATLKPMAGSVREARIGDLEVVPRKQIDHKGVTLEELDVEAVIERGPQIALIDELAHTNVPGSKNRKRYQDVEEILAAGINVISTLNIQHLESINEFVEKATGVKVRETLRDRLVREAELINVDLPVDALRERLRSGLIYPPERIERALQNFFTEENLAVLRELSLHETARDLEARYAARRRTNGVKTAEHQQVMVAISSKPDVKRLIRRGGPVAGRMGTDWYVIYIKSPREAPTDFRHCPAPARREPRLRPRTRCRGRHPQGGRHRGRARPLRQGEKRQLCDPGPYPSQPPGGVLARECHKPLRPRSGRRGRAGRVLTYQTKTFTRIEIDENAKRFIEKASKGDEIHIIAHRRRFSDDPEEYARKLEEQREYNHIPQDVRALFLEIHVEDLSEFEEEVLEVRGVNVGSYSVLRGRARWCPTP